LELAEMTASDWRAALVPAVLHHEYPLHPVAIPIARIAERARSQGVKVLLTGEASDELFGGYPGEHARVYRESLPLRMRARRGYDAILGVGLARLPRTAVRVAMRAMSGRSQRSNDAPDPFAADGQSRQLRERLERHAFDAYQHHDGPERRIEATLLAGLSHRPLPELLNRMDKNALQSAIEARVPYLDPEVVALVVNLPLRERIGPQPKGILRDLARRLLPRRTAMRPKRNGLWPDTHRLVREAARPGFWEDGRMRDLLEVPHPVWRDRIAGLRSDEQMWLCSAEIWSRLFLDGQGVQAVEAELWGDGA
jgi:asparagine synthase (glutamine-hydrolysing)